jgi:hypothetical protein
LVSEAEGVVVAVEGARLVTVGDWVSVGNIVTVLVPLDIEVIVGSAEGREGSVGEPVGEGDGVGELVGWDGGFGVCEAGCVPVAGNVIVAVQVGVWTAVSVDVG